MNKTKAIALLGAGLLTVSLSACGGADETETEVLDPTKHATTAAESLKPQWNNNARMAVDPLEAAPEAARDLPETRSLGIDNLDVFNPTFNQAVPAKLAVTSWDKETRALDLDTGALYDVSPKKFDGSEDKRMTTTMMLVADDGKTKGASLVKTVESTQGLQTEKVSLSTFLDDFASFDEPTLAEVDSKNLDAKSAEIIAASAEKIYLANIPEAGSKKQIDVVAVDIASGQETRHEHIETNDFFGVIAQSGEPVLYYASNDGDLRRRNLESGEDVEIRKGFAPEAVWRIGDDALVYGKDTAEQERCTDEPTKPCEAKFLYVSGGKADEAMSMETRTYSSVPVVRRSGDVITAIFTSRAEGIVKLLVLKPESGEVLLELGKDELKKLDFVDAISDGESIFTYDGNRTSPRVAQSDVKTKELITADADVFPIDSPSGARIWGVKRDDGDWFEARVAVEDLDKF